MVIGTFSMAGYLLFNKTKPPEMGRNTHAQDKELPKACQTGTYEEMPLYQLLRFFFGREEIEPHAAYIYAQKWFGNKRLFFYGFITYKTSYMAWACFLLEGP